MSTQNVCSAPKDRYANLPEYKGDTTICRKCGNCCKIFSAYIPTEEAWRIRNLVGIKIRFYDIGDGYSRIVFDYPCRFLKEENGYYTCIIHEDKDGQAIRPGLCKAYPQTFLNNLENTLLAEIEACPIIAAAMAGRIP